MSIAADKAPPAKPQAVEAAEGWRIVHSSGETVVTQAADLVRELKAKPGARAFKVKRDG